MTNDQVGPANAFVNLAPRHITFEMGGIITATLGAVIFPWRLLSSSSSFIGWLVAYSSLLGPVIGVIIADFWLVRKRQLDVDGLYSDRPEGPYFYSNGYNWAAVVSLVWLLGLTGRGSCACSPGGCLAASRGLVTMVV
jgi:NCS1 family nucleobase:cation symporter-1